VTTAVRYIDTVDELRALVGYPAERSIAKERSTLDRHAIAFLAQSPFCLLATSDADGACDVAPRGDEPGFALVLEPETLVLPERPGNKRLDNLANIVANPHVGLLFLIPGTTHTLRVNGSARIVAEAAYFADLAVYGRPPILAIEVTVEQVYFHCAKALIRSRLWSSSEWPDPSSVESLGQVLRAQVGLSDADAAAVDARGSAASRPDMF
jgi:PPOX class probable FMN-dependent enzyme